MGNNKIKIDVFGGPHGNRGFRSGWWCGKIGSFEFDFYASIPHCMNLIEQEIRLADCAISAIRNNRIIV